MEKDFLELFAVQGTFAILFCYLLFYVLKENSKREASYQNIIIDLTGAMPEIRKDIENIKNKIL